MKQLRSYAEGEVPASLVVAFLDENDEPIATPQPAWSAKWVMGRVADDEVIELLAPRAASLSSAGEATYDWQIGDMVPGAWLGEMWVSNGILKLRSERFRWIVTESLSTPSFS